MFVVENYQYRPAGKTWVNREILRVCCTELQVPPCGGKLGLVVRFSVFVVQNYQYRSAGENSG